MTDEKRLKLLSLGLRVFGVFLLALFTVLIVFTAIDSPLMEDGGALVWLRWKPFSKHVELMLEVVYWVWAVFLLKASRDPLRYLSFLDFTAWANLAHGVLMLVQTFLLEHHMHKLVTDDLLTLLLAGLIFWLRPRGATETR